jgi:hypothetical protein
MKNGEKWGQTRFISQERPESKFWTRNLTLMIIAVINNDATEKRGGGLGRW